MKLNEETLRQLPDSVRRPLYDRGALRQHTVHMGVGGFHRAHQAVYLDDLLAMDGEPRWGECGLGVLPSDDKMRDALKSQDCLYTLLERSESTETARVVGSIADYLYAPEDRERAIEKLAAEETRIVSLTITEGGYFLNEGTGKFDPERPEIQKDLKNPGAPETSIGLIAEALERRRQRGMGGWTLMSCDNLQSNGAVVRGVLLGFAAMRGGGLEPWIAEHVAFPNSMVDRITPVTTAGDREELRAKFGIEDAWPVMTELFLQWVIEDHFVSGRPAWEKVGAQIVPDVAPYELMKMRLLNGSHLAMAYLGALAGYTYVHEVMHDELFVAFIEQFMEEVTPVVPEIPGVSIPEYRKTLIERFANPAIRDQVTRICSEGSAKIPKWLLPSIVELLQMGRAVKLSSLVVASWIRYLQKGVDERGKPLEILDARAPELRAVAQSVGDDPRPMLAVRSIFGDVLSAHEGFAREVQGALEMLDKAGVAATLRRYTAGGERAR